jgi:hypothetical protein
MNWAAVAAVTSLIGLLATIIGTAYNAGQIRQEVKNQRERIDGHGERLDQHEEKLGTHQEKLGRLEEWKNGFNAAARVSGRDTV